MRLKALKDVLVKLGVTPAGEKTCGEVIEKIADVAGGGGGSDVFVVNFSWPDDDIIADKSLDEIIEASKSGKVVLGNYEGETMVMNGWSDQEGYEYVNFEKFLVGDQAEDQMLSLTYRTWSLDKTGKVTQYTQDGTFVAV